MGRKEGQRDLQLPGDTVGTEPLCCARVWGPGAGLEGLGGLGQGWFAVPGFGGRAGGFWGAEQGPDRQDKNAGGAPGLHQPHPSPTGV